MGDWIRKLPQRPTGTVLRAPVPEDAHDCVMPVDAEAGPRSLWQCECGCRWRMTVPYWRPIGGEPNPGTAALSSPPWLRLLDDGPRAAEG